MKKTKLTRSLMAAVSIVALSAVMYGCVHSGDDGEAPVVVDMDGDGVADVDDAFPNDATEWADTDGDGRGDNAHAPDRDNDGVADVADAFPDDATETQDSDEDGVGNNADAFPFDRTETADGDGDGVGDNADAFPMDATETADADGDGVGDNADVFPGDDDQRRGGRLVQVANAYGVEDLATTPTVDEQAQAVMPFVTAVNTAAAAADNGETGTTAMATWPAVPDDPETANTDESAMNVLSIDVTPANMGGALEFRTEAAEENDPNTTVDETIVTATDIGGLGDFMNGYLISDGNRHVIVFTDKDQNDAPVTELTGVEAATLTNDPVTGSTVTDLGTSSGTGYTGVTYYDGVNAVTDQTDTNLAYMGSLTCPDGMACMTSTDADGNITVTGYIFTGSREATAAVMPMTAEQQATANNDYLAFGVWLNEDGDGSGNPDFGAFADGGSTATVVAAVTGTATYNGSATGVYTAGSSVDYFQGDATLIANFGMAPDDGTDDTALGSITGMIDNIVAGGMDMSDVINLNDDADAGDNITGTGAFSGDARMGAGTTMDAVTTYPYNGTWGGQFYNGTEDDDETTDVDESMFAPGSVAGTFGVTGTTGTGDDAVTRSYLGAFGAHQDD